MGTRLKIINGTQYNNLTIIKEVEQIGTIRYFKCKCICGKILNTRLDAMRSNHTKGCGCINKRRTTLGMTGTRFKSIWNCIGQRCTNPNNTRYSNYGGRGIKCEWKNFAEFYKDMYSDYLKHYKENNGDTTIEREDNNGNYCKKNCKWKTYKQQANNKSTNRILRLYGISKTMSEWSNVVGLNYSILSSRLYRGWTIEKAILTPNLKT